MKACAGQAVAISLLFLGGSMLGMLGCRFGSVDGVVNSKTCFAVDEMFELLGLLYRRPCGLCARVSCL